MAWHKHFPPDCPPEDSYPPEGIAYRFVKNDPPAEEDFIDHRRKFPDRHFNDECIACGLSVYTEWEDVLIARQMVPGMNRKKIAMGPVEIEQTVIKNTPSDTLRSHHTWWLSEEVKVHECFEITEIWE